MKKKRFFLINLGCKVNLWESNAIACQLIAKGLKATKNINQAEIVIINTCSVTHHADMKSINAIKKAQCANLKPIVVVMGCFSQINQDWFKNKNIPIVIGNKDKDKIPNLIFGYLQNKKMINNLVPIKKIKNFEYLPNNYFLNNTRAFLKIQDGCDFYCSYCTIPFCRGKSRSLDHEIVLEMVKNYVNKGYQEIVLTGINITNYQDKNYNFLTLLKDLNKIAGNFRIRISSIEPSPLLFKIIDLMANNKDRWTNHLHLCLQSANNEILKKMNRKYTIQQFMKIVSYARKKIKNIAITTDYIVAFPTETKKNFNQALKNLKKINFADMNIFHYSQRKLTIAYKKYKENLNSNEIKTRYQQLLLLKKENQKKYLTLFLQKTLEIIVEKSNSTTKHGYSSEYIRVFFTSKKDLWKKKVLITAKSLHSDKKGYFLKGKLTKIVS